MGLDGVEDILDRGLGVHLHQHVSLSKPFYYRNSFVEAREEPLPNALDVIVNSFQILGPLQNPIGHDLLRAE